MTRREYSRSLFMSRPPIMYWMSALVMPPPEKAETGPTLTRRFSLPYRGMMFSRMNVIASIWL